MQWKNGGPLALAAELEAREAGLRQDAHDMLQEIATEARNNQRDLIERAKTPTGERRAAADRGVAGRVETGDMFNGVDGNATWVDDNTISAKWGWQDPEDYYTFQDQGTRHIAPALSLLTSFLVARSDFAVRLRGLLRKGSA